MEISVAMKIFIYKFIGVLLLLWSLSAFPQTNIKPDSYTINKRDLAETRARQVEYLTLPDHYKKIQLPSEVNNALKPYFRGIFSQEWYPTCMQCSSIGYVYNYEINRVRKKPADTSINRHAVLYTWNYANDEGVDGLDFFFSWDIIKNQGIPDVATFGADAVEYPPTVWMSGYDKYYKAMGNRLDDIYGIRLDSEEGINTLRAWLFDHLEGSPDGGFAVFASSGYGPMLRFETGTPEAGKFFYPYLLNFVSHGLSIVGNNDSVRYDYNSDGRYTNNIDINNDGEVNVLDWEKGAFKIVNSSGPYWADSAFIYIMYNSMARKQSDGGIWNSSVYVLKASPEYKPELTMKVRLKHNYRESIRIRAGISQQAGAVIPEQIIEFPIFNFQGGMHGMKGLESLPDPDEIEVGFDISELKKYIEPGIPARFFLLVDEHDPQNLGSGEVLDYSVIDYMSGGIETAWNQGAVEIENNSTTSLYVDKVLLFNKMAITNQALPIFENTQPVEIQMNATGGEPPYKWSLNYPYRKSDGEGNFNAINQFAASPFGVESNVAIGLPFPFPFYGKSYDTVYMNRKGLLVFANEALPPRYFDDYLFLLKNNIVVNPAFRDEYYADNTDGDGMWYAFSQDTLYFRWKLSLTGSGPVSDVNFEVRLLKTGEILFNYGTIEVPDSISNYPGVSAGNNMSFLLDNAVKMNTFQGQKFKYLPSETPLHVRISTDGLLSVQQTDCINIQSVNIEVTDSKKNGAQRTFSLTNGLDFNAYPVSGEGSYINYNGISNLNLNMMNRLPDPVQNLRLILRCKRSNVIVTDSILEVNSLPGGSSIISENAFSFKFSKPAHASEAIDFEVIAEYSENQKIKKTSFVVAAPQLVAYKAFVNDGANHLIDPGETTQVDFSLHNTGNLKSGPVSVSVGCIDERVTVTPVSSLSFDSIETGEHLKINCLVSASRDIPITDSIFITVAVSSDPLQDTSYVFGFQIGSPSVALINLSGQASTVNSMAKILDNLNVPYQKYANIPDQLSNFNAVFLTLGCTTPNHKLTDIEYLMLKSYLKGGGRLYLEGYYFYLFNEDNPLQNLFRYKLQSVPLYLFKALKGIPGAPTNGMEMLYDGDMFLSIHELQPEAGTVILLENQDGKTIQYAFDGGYRTIGSLCEFGEIRDTLPPSSKADLMKVYLNYFGVDLSGIQAFFHSDYVQGCSGIPFNFYDDSYDQVTSRSWSFQGGTPPYSNEANPQVVYTEPGVYDVGLTVSNGTAERTITKKAFITVHSCEGIFKTDVEAGIELFPNPAGDEINFTLPKSGHDYKLCVIRNISGETELQLPLNRLNTSHTLNVSRLKAGFYFLNLYKDNGQFVTCKLIKR